MTSHTVTCCKKANKNIIIIYQHSRILREGLGQSYKGKKWRTGQQTALKEKEIEVSVEIALKKLEGYVIKNYLYLIMPKYQLQFQPTNYSRTSNTDTEGTEQSVRIREVSVV